MATEQEFIATGRRKNAVARIRMTAGTGVIEINGRPLDEYFKTLPLQNTVLKPFEVAKLVNTFDVRVNAHGGGVNGQAGAVRLAVSRALIEQNPELRPALKAEGLLTRDPRMKERKKSGQPGARKRFQFSKR
jgi:small subunit ribosomal protein S9